MNPSEVLFCALLLCTAAESAPNGRFELDKWSSLVLSEERRATELAAAWKPPGEKRIAIDFFSPLEHVFNKRSWPRPVLDMVGRAMQAWRGEGQFDGLDGELLHNYIDRTPLAACAVSKTKPPARWKSWAVVRIARLLYSSAHTLRKLLKLDAESEEAKPAHVVMAEPRGRCSSRSQRKFVLGHQA